MMRETALHMQDIGRLEETYPAAFQPSFVKRYSLVIALGLSLFYTLYCIWFFAIGKTVEDANWDIAGSYLADWVSYEAKPDIEFDGDYLRIQFPRFSPFGENPKPEWIIADRRIVTRTLGETQVADDAEKSAPASPGSFMAPSAPTGKNTATSITTAPQKVTEEVVTKATIVLGDGRLTVQPGLVTVVRGEEEFAFGVSYDKSVTALTEASLLPDWIEQRGLGGKVRLSFGSAGRAEIQNDEVHISKRFWGWENYSFDTGSKLWHISGKERLVAIFGGERLDPDQSNVSLAWRDFLHNPSWQHYDVWLKLLQTIVMAFVGTVFASLLAFPLAFLAARNITPSRIANQGLKRVFDFLRSVDMLIWALFFTRGFGPGPLAGISAIFFTDTGTLGKLYSEALENIDDRQREGVKSVGAHNVLIQRYGVIPQILPVFLSQSLYFWESNTRSATIIGAVGAGGIGLKLWEAMRTNQDWENVAYMVILILIVVFIFDNISNAIRSRLISGGGHEHG